jgi:predicted lipoprotein with Yx(FWY)xxD motif
MPRPSFRLAALAAFAAVAVACSSPAGTAAPTSAAPSVAPTSAAPSSAAPSSAAPSASAPTTGGLEITTGSGTPGTFLVGPSGLTLYTFTNDTQGDGKSVCNGDCATAWPPLIAEGGATPTAGAGVDAAKFGTATRDDGTTQITYDGWPLYYFQGDSAAGQTNGEGLQGVWFVAKP